MTSLQTDIIKTLAYFDVFKHPLTANEIYKTLPVKLEFKDGLQKALTDLLEKGEIQELDSFYFLKRQSPDIVHSRMTCEKTAVKMLRYARRMARVIKCFPFVRGIFITGSLSKNIADQNSDIDFFIITAPHRIWICRTLLTVFKKVFLFNKNKFFCINYIVSTEALSIDRNNIYTAVEVATVKPLWNAALFVRFCDSNRWIHAFLPNWEFSCPNGSMIGPGRSFVQRGIEFLLQLFPADKLDRWLMERWKKIWQSRHAYLSEDQRDMQFQCSPHVSTRWDNDYYRDILSKIQAD